MQKLLVPPGESQKITCPEGSQPVVNTADVLGSGENKAGVFVISVNKQDILLGPLQAGVWELPPLCSNGQAQVTLEIVPPQPDQDAKLMTLPTQSLTYPGWLWIVLGTAILIAAIGAFVFGKIQKRKRLGKIQKQRRTKKTPEQRMIEFLREVKKEKLVEKTDYPSASMLYANGIRNLRSLLQKTYEFRAPGLTHKEFPSELKHRNVKQKHLSTLELSKVESLFMQAYQVSYSQEIPPTSSKQAYLKGIEETAKLLLKKISEKEEAQFQGKKKKLFKKKKPVKKEGSK